MEEISKDVDKFFEENITKLTLLSSVLDKKALDLQLDKQKRCRPSLKKVQYITLFYYM